MNINQQIENSNYTRYEISKLSGVSESTLSRIKNDPNYDPKQSTVKKIEAVINIVSKQNK